MDHLTQPLNEGHKVLGDEDYCSGYMDPFGKWNNGFPCPVLEENEPVYCCGTESLKYCCINPKTPVLPPVPHLALLLGVTFGIAVAVIVVITVSCFHCSCCLLYKKRQPTSRGSVYHMHCSSSNAAGVANMYSFSGTTTPTDTPRSVSRSRFMTDSAPSTISYASYDLSDLRICSDFQGHTYSRVRNDNSRPGSIAFSDQSTSTLSDITVREVTNTDRMLRNSQAGAISLSHFEAPPPYSAPHSTLVAVRTSTSNNESTAIPFNSRANSTPSHAPLTNQQANQAPTLNPTALQTQNTFQEIPIYPGLVCDTLSTGRELRTFSQSIEPSASTTPTAVAALTLATRLPMIITNSQPNQQSDQPLLINQNQYSNVADGYSNRIYANSQAVLNNEYNNLVNNPTHNFVNSQIRNMTSSQAYNLAQNIRTHNNLTYDLSPPRSNNPNINNTQLKSTEPRLTYTATKF